MNDSSGGSGVDNFGRSVFLNLLKACWKHQDHLWPATKSVTVFRKGDVRISIASLLRLEKDGRFLLIRNPNRPEAYGPIGGVFKYYPMALDQLDKMEFRGRQIHVDGAEDFERDLRGELPATNLPIFLNWFKARQGREEQDCIRRELREELQLIGVPGAIQSVAERLSFSLVRRVHEGPFKHANLPIPQFRYFEVFRLVTSAGAEDTIDNLFALAENKPDDLLVASTSEIQRLRARDGRVIGGHSQYLFSSKWHGAEPPEYVVN